jgi:hypothetical protein
MKKLLVVLGISGLVYWFARSRAVDDEFTFTEVPQVPPDADVE